MAENDDSEDDLPTGPARFITDRLAYIVEAAGGEVTVTLLVDGAIVEGQLTPGLRYREWAHHLLEVSLEVGSGEVDFSTEPIDDVTMKRVVSEWDESSLKRESEEQGTFPHFDTLYLRDAVILGGMPMQNRHFAYIAIDATHVGAVSIGRAIRDE